MMLVERIRNPRFLPLDTYPRAIDLAQRPIGKVILLALFALLMIPLKSITSVPITLAAGVCAFAGQYRSPVRTLATMMVAFLQPNWFDWLDRVTPTLHDFLTGEATLREVLAVRMDMAFSLWPMLVAFFSFAVLAMYFFRRYRQIPFTRRPVVCMLVLFGGFVWLASSGLLNGFAQHMLWTFVAVFGAYFWFLCYALGDQKLKDGDKPLVQLGVFHPFWGSGSTPLGKGAAYLRKVEAKTPRELAITQLKALKLLMWVLILALLNYLLELSASSVDIPGLQDGVEDAIARQTLGQSYAWYICWANLIYSFFHDMLTLTIRGGCFVAVARFAGYRLLRNTYRPLSSTTVAEFWNRYYFYYKELLVEMFFFPTFFRCFKTHRRLRVFFATIMAATVGNFIFHFIDGIKYSADLGFAQQLLGFQSLAFYCLALGVGIGISQMRIRRNKRYQSWVRRRLAPSVGVLNILLSYKHLCRAIFAIFAPRPFFLFLSRHGLLADESGGTG